MNKHFLTDQGKVRKQNEDAVGLFENQAEQTLAIVADGMGGHKAGDVASKIVRSLFLEEWEKTETISTSDEAKTWLEQCIQQANQLVYQHAKNNPDCDGMGTTVIATIFTGSNITIAHIGDSRCYLFSKTMSQITEDHTLVNELVRNGELTKKEADVHPQKNILMKALGTDKSINPDIFSVEWNVDDRLLICSDGLSDKVSDSEIETILSQDQPIETISKQLVERANELGGEDNITVIIVENATDGKGESAC